MSDSILLTIDDEQRPLERVGTKGMLVLQNDEIVEEYWDQHDSAAVSIVFRRQNQLFLPQIAVQDGYIGSWDDLVTDYIPEYEIPEGVTTPTLRHLSTMAGLQFDETARIHSTKPNFSAMTWWQPR